MKVKGKSKTSTGAEELAGKQPPANITVNKHDLHACFAKTNSGELKQRFIFAHMSFMYLMHQNRGRKSQMSATIKEDLLRVHVKTPCPLPVSELLIRTAKKTK